MEQLLTVIEMVEVFLELAALQCGGPGARWAVHRVTGEQRYITAATHRHTASSRPLRQPAQHSK